jgi:hypothetical protein
VREQILKRRALAWLAEPGDRRLIHNLQMQIVLDGLCWRGHLQGRTTMPWFNKRAQKEAWEAEIEWPIGDLEAARKIREICNSAMGSTEIVGGRSRGAAETKANRRETEKYKRAAKIAMGIAIKISDDLLRDAAVSQIVVLCARANDFAPAATLLRAVQAISIREGVLSEYPALRDAVLQAAGGSLRKPTKEI